MSSLRQRKNITPSFSSIAENHLARHQLLVRQINKASEDDDEDTVIKEAIMFQQVEANKRIAKSQMISFLFLGGVVVVLYLYLDIDPNNQSSLVKALGVLIGLNKRTRVALPETAKIFASTSIMKSDLDQFIYPSWRWLSSKNNAQFLVPKSGRGGQIQDILHRTSLLKKDRGIAVELYDPSDIQLFLQGEHGLKCNSAVDSESKTIFDQYVAFGQSGENIAQKMIWMWCALYSGEAYGFLDLDAYEVHLGPSLVHSLSKNRIKNFVMDSNAIEVKDGSSIDHSLVTSVMFIPEKMSSVAEGMLQFNMDVDPGKIPNDFAARGIHHMNGLIEKEKESWTLARTNCAEHTNTFTLADVCSPVGCCEVTWPRKS
jgi:hypothetical protein